MSLTLKELKESSSEIADLAGATRDVATNHTNSADFCKSLATASTWEGDGGDAARTALMASAGEHDAAADNLGAAAARMEQAQEAAERVANQIKGILDDAAAPPVVQIDESTNQVIPPDTSFLDEEAAAIVAAKVADLRERIAAVLADGDRVDADLASAIAAATGAPASEGRAESSFDGLLLPDAGERKPAASDPDDLGGALDQLAGTPIPNPGETASGASAPSSLAPKAIETFKNSARRLMQQNGVPSDQIEQRLDAMVAVARKPLPPNVSEDPEAMPTPGFGEGFADRWFETEQSIRNLLGQGGPGAPGVLESWRDLVQGTNERVTNPVGAAIDDVKDALNSPSLAYYLGEKSADAAATAPSLMFGGEAALLRGGLGSAIPDDLVDIPSPTSAIEHHTPLGGPDHHTPLDGGYQPSVDGAPLLAEHGRPEFTLSNPVDHMGPELLRLSEQNLTGSGETVLGPYKPDGGGPSYIDVAEQRGASYFVSGKLGTPPHQSNDLRPTSMYLTPRSRMATV